MNLFAAIEQNININIELNFLLNNSELININSSEENILNQLRYYNIDVIKVSKVNHNIKIYLANNIWELNYDRTRT